MKIRGTAAHIAEKYMSLARDALASGDMVTAESYLQHAEHYNRIIMAAQSQMGAQHNSHQGEGPNGGGYRPQRWNADEEGEEDAIEAVGGGGIGSQDRERHMGDREHHGAGREGGGRDARRHGGNGRETSRGENGSDQPESTQGDESAPDQVS